MHLNAHQKKSLLSLYREDIEKKLSVLYHNDELVKCFSPLLPEKKIDELILKYSGEACYDFGKELWESLLNAPTIGCLYEALLNFLGKADPSLHTTIAAICESNRTSSFKLILDNFDAIVDNIDAEETLTFLESINSYTLICNKIRECMKDQGEPLKRLVILRTVPFFGKMGAYDILKSMHKTKETIVDSIIPNFSNFYELLNHERSNPRGIVQYIPADVEAVIGNSEQIFVTVDLNWEDFPKTGIRKKLYDTLEFRKFSEIPIVLRDYQVELAEPAINGKNSIISAPTGCGKTIIAAHIIKNHIEKLYESQDYKVLFLVNSTPIIEQQCAVIYKYLNHKYDVAYTSGADNVSVLDVIKTKDIIVCTPQLIVNILSFGKDGFNAHDEKFCLSEFSLIIFDECHNARKDSPYAKLMTCYHELNFTKRHKKKLPQIVGLTASLGVGKSKSVTDAITHIVGVCAKLDCKTISRVRKCTKELDISISQPRDTICVLPEECEIRTKFHELIVELMMKVQANCLAMLAAQSLDRTELCNSFKAPPSPEMEAFEQWVCCHLRHYIPKFVVPIPDFKAHLVAHFEFLLLCYRTLELHGDFTSKEALNYLLEELEKITIPTSLNLLWLDCKKNLIQLHASNNQMIEAVVNLLLEQRSANASFRAVIFIKTRIATTILAKTLNGRSVLRDHIDPIKAEPLFGINKQSMGIKQSKNDQADTLDRFRSGLTKVLICTSTAEEGLDVEKCNLVIKYNYVTNEIAHVQRRGRGRALEARSIFITNKTRQQRKEEENIMKESLMNSALAAIDNLDFEDMVTLQINSEYEEVLKKKATEALNVRTVSDKKEIFKILCIKCDEQLCMSYDVKRHLNNMHVITCGDIWKKVTRIELPEEEIRQNKYGGIAKICCNTCRNLVGRVQKIKDVDFPNIAVSGFHLQSELNNNRYVFKQWKKVHEIFLPSVLGLCDLTTMQLANKAAFFYDDKIVNLKNN